MNAEYTAIIQSGKSISLILLLLDTLSDFAEDDILVCAMRKTLIDKFNSHLWTNNFHKNDAKNLLLQASLSKNICGIALINDDRIELHLEPETPLNLMLGIVYLAHSALSPSFIQILGIVLNKLSTDWLDKSFAFTRIEDTQSDVQSTTTPNILMITKVLCDILTKNDGASNSLKKILITALSNYLTEIYPNREMNVIFKLCAQ